MFPGPGAQIIYNEDGEPLGWDYPSFEPPDLDPYEMEDRYGAQEAWAEDQYERGYEDGERAHEIDDVKPDKGASNEHYQNGFNDGWGTACLNDPACQANGGH